MKIGHRLIHRVLFIAAAITSVATLVYSQEQPTLSARYEVADFVRNLPATAPQPLRDFRGLFIEYNYISELLPFATSIFFDPGSADFSTRYVLYTDPAQTAGFDEEKIPGGTLQKYFQLLNIIGSRLRLHPDKSISIAGCNSGDRSSGETRQLSAQRGVAVRDYLVNIWGIAPDRVTLLPPRDLPKHPSNPNDPDGAAENRRVDIISSDWDITHSIHYGELRRYPQPDFMQFEMSNGVADSVVVRREIVITRGRLTWHVMTDIGLTERLSPKYNWGMNDNEDSIPEDSAPYTAQLIVYTADGEELISNRVEVPVKIFTNRDRDRICVDCRREIRRYSLVLFPFDDARLGSINQRILKEYVYQGISQDASVTVTGHTDDIGSYSHNDALSEQRADAVVRDMRKNVRDGVIVSLEARGAGESAPFFNNDLPEGRFFNRTVEVVIENPRPGSPE
jgi:outer membrane protein OmpA-like peptidoglycan-associated protein